MDTLLKDNESKQGIIHDPIMPRAYLDTHEISGRKKARLEALEKYDLSVITNDFVDRGRYFSPEQIWPLKDYFGKVDEEITSLLEREFKRFVALTILEPNHIYAPPGSLDMYWHFFVLHTRNYAHFCAEVWGDAHDHGALPMDVNDIRSPARAPVVSGDDSRALVEHISLVPKRILLGLEPEMLQKIHLLEQWDLSFFTERLIENERRFSPEQLWPIVAHFGTASREIANILEREFKKFIALTLLDKPETLVPSGPIDMYWHFLILHTKEYREFSHIIWGRFRHYPLRQIEGGNQPVNGFERTKALYKDVFEEIDLMVWCDPSIEIA